MRSILTVALVGVSLVRAGEPAPILSAPIPTLTVAPSEPASVSVPAMMDGESRGFLESDRAFPNFIGPISNPILTKDPRSLTELRPLFINNNFPGANPVLQGGSAQIVAAQARFALTERLTLTADKDGWANIRANGLPHQSGFLNIGAGLKYTFVRDVENQFLAAVGIMYEIPSGEDAVFQGNGPGLWTGYVTVGKEFGDNYHVIVNAGYQIGNSRYNSDMAYAQLHLDKQICGWLYPLVELNWFGYTSGGNVLPRALGEGDGLVNFGTMNVSGLNIVTGAVGLKAMLSRNVEVGVAYETPLTSRDNLFNHRVIAELILRY